MERNTTQRKDVIPNERERVLGPALHERTPWVKAGQKVRVLEERKSSRRATLSRRAIVQKEMPVIAGMHLSVSFHQHICVSRLNIGSHPCRRRSHFAKVKSEG